MRIYFWSQVKTLILCGLLVMAGGNGYADNTAYTAEFNLTDWQALQGLSGVSLDTVSTHTGLSVIKNAQALYFTADPNPSPGDFYRGYVTFGAGLTLPVSTLGLDIVGSLMGTLTATSTFLQTSTINLSGNLLCGPGFNVGSGAAKIQIECCDKLIQLSDNLTLGSSATNGFRLVAGAGSNGLIIDGGGHVLTLTGGSSSIDLAASTNLTVTLRNMTLVLTSAGPLGLGNGGVSPYNNSLTLDNVRVLMGSGHSTYYFGAGMSTVDNGRLCIENNVSFSGPGATFLYSSTRTLSLAPGATLSFEPGTTFQWANGSANGLYMSDRTSKLRFNNSTLNVPTGYGLQLKNGALEFDNLVFIENGGQADVTKGLILGDGVNTSNNVAVNVLSGAYVVVDGVMYYNQA